LEKDFEDFPNQSMGKTEIEGVDDKEEITITDVSIFLQSLKVTVAEWSWHQAGNPWFLRSTFDPVLLETTKYFQP